MGNENIKNDENSVKSIMTDRLSTGAARSTSLHLISSHYD